MKKYFWRLRFSEGSGENLKNVVFRGYGVVSIVGYNMRGFRYCS